MDALNTFRTDLLNQASAKATSEGLFLSESFLEIVLGRLVESGELEEASLAYYRGSGSNNRNLAVDGYDLSGDDDTVSLFVLDFEPTDTARRVPWTEVTKLLSACAAFADEASRGSSLQELEPSSPVFGLAESIRRREVAIARFKIYCITDGLVSSRPKDFKIPAIGAAVVDWHVYDSQRLFAGAAAGSEREPIEIDFLSRGGPLPCLKVQDAAEMTTYLLALPGDLLADLYHEQGTRLLESNVRAFLSARGKVNRGIRDTLANHPEKFMPYNNGITATASGVQLEGIGEGLRITGITDLQIVNGGQTTASLYYSRRDYKADLSDVHVQMKLVQVPSAIGEKLVPDIARFANSQNKVSEADFFSNHPYHQRLEQLGNQILVPASAGSLVSTHWFYERTRGSWDNQRNRNKGAAMKAFESQYPRNQIITKTDAAKYVVTWDGKPHIVSQGAQKNFIAHADDVTKLWDNGGKRINEDYYKQLVAMSILFNGIRKGILTSDWYDKGYLANITTYTLAAFRHSFVKQFRQEIDLEHIWREQAIPEPLLAANLQLAGAVSGVLTSEKRPVVNVTEWAKRAECWNQVKALDFELPSELQAFGVDGKTRLRRAAEAAYVQETDVKLLNEIEILEKPDNFWAALSAFGMKNRLIDSRTSGIISALQRKKIPSEAQMRVLQLLIQKAEERGFEAPEAEE